MNDRMEESIVESSGDINEDGKVEEQSKIIMNSIVTVGESALNQRLSDMRKDVEKSQMELDKSVRMVEDMLKDLEKLKSSMIPDELKESKENNLRVGQEVFAMTSPNLLSPWQQATLLSVSQGQYQLQLPSSLHQPVSLTQLAYSHAPEYPLTVGSRCIALYKEDAEGGFFLGVVGEMPKHANSGRYLVFYDDGYACYVSPADVRQVCEASKEVWVDVEPSNREFIKRYLGEYPWRKLVKLVEGDQIITEVYEEWVLAEVTEIDASLAEITFVDQEACEWIYRGSRRFQPMRKLLEMSLLKVPSGKLIQQLVPDPLTKPYMLHECSPSCITPYRYLTNQHKTSSLLTIPLHLGWRREVATHRDSEVQGNWTVHYTSPCGRRLRNMKEVHTFLEMCKSNLSVDMFAYDCWLRVLDLFEASQDILSMADISHGAERMPIPACNQYSNTPPPYMEYSSVAIPQPGVKANCDADPGFLLGCDCTDDCQDKVSCSCRQLTIQATACDWEGLVNTHAGYIYRRLPDVVLTGIYECNQACACTTTCLNRVVQLPLRAKLEVFKTESKGWGIRTLVDLPQGAFVCTYVGRLYGSEQEAGYEDAYFADMDMIEVVERRKEGYESDVSDIEDGEDDIAIIINNNNNNKDIRSNNEKPKFKSTRQLFGPGQEIFIMDAMNQGNIGRYFNHSCNPNTFVQNVFVSRHDLRFPTLAFFTMKFVPAGTELCWDYSYRVGTLPGKKIDCHCGADNCRKRLL